MDKEKLKKTKEELDKILGETGIESLKNLEKLLKKILEAFNGVKYVDTRKELEGIRKEINDFSKSDNLDKMSKKIEEYTERIVKAVSGEKILFETIIKKIDCYDSQKIIDKIDEFIKKNNETKEVIVKNQKEFPKLPEFPKEISVKNFPDSESPAIIKTITEGFVNLLLRLKAALSAFITNKNPEDAIPVKLVDAQGRSFYTARGGNAGGGGVSIDLSVLEGMIGDQLSNYFISDEDDDASPNYYGFIDKNGNWYIMKETVSAGADTYRYAEGTSDYSTNWTNRVGLSYDYFNIVF